MRWRGLSPTCRPHRPQVRRPAISRWHILPSNDFSQIGRTSSTRSVDRVERRTPMKIAMVSEHASPLAVLGGADAGGQNVHVAELSAALTRRGHEVTVYTRRDDPKLPERVEVP